MSYFSQWYAVRTATRRERQALAALSERGFTAFLPMETRIRQTSFTREVVDTPLFPGYMFVLCREEDFRPILDVEGVHAFVCQSRADGEPTPAPFPAAAILGLQIEERSGMFDRTRKKKIPYRPKKGEKVKITAGTWMGFIAEVLNTPRGQRAHVMVEAFGRRRGMTVEVDHLAAA